MTTQGTEYRTPPEPLPVPAGNLKDQMKELRKVFGDPAEGLSAEVDEKFIKVREYAKFAIAYWNAQLDAADLELLLQAKNAEVLTVGGVPVLKQYADPVEAHPVAATTRRGFRVINR